VDSSKEIITDKSEEQLIKNELGQMSDMDVTMLEKNLLKLSYLVERTSRIPGETKYGAPLYADYYSGAIVESEEKGKLLIYITDSLKEQSNSNSFVNLLKNANEQEIVEALSKLKDFFGLQNFGDLEDTNKLREIRKFITFQNVDYSFNELNDTKKKITDEYLNYYVKYKKKKKRSPEFKFLNSGIGFSIEVQNNRLAVDMNATEENKQTFNKLFGKYDYLYFNDNGGLQDAPLILKKQLR
jgi:hypothetical protein